MLGRRLLNVVDGHAPLGAAAQVGSQQALGFFQRQGADPGAGAHHQRVERAFKLADTVGEAVGQELHDVRTQRRVEALLATQDLKLALQDAKTQGAVGRLDAAD